MWPCPRQICALQRLPSALILSCDRGLAIMVEAPYLARDVFRCPAARVGPAEGHTLGPCGSVERVLLAPDSRSRAGLRRLARLPEVRDACEGRVEGPEEGRRGGAASFEGRSSVGRARPSRGGRFLIWDAFRRHYLCAALVLAGLGSSSTESTPARRPAKTRSITSANRKVKAEMLCAVGGHAAHHCATSTACCLTGTFSQPRPYHQLCTGRAEASAHSYTLTLTAYTPH
jgi:hypothetical protein